MLRIAISDPTARCPLSIKFGCEPGQEAIKLIEEAKRLDVPLVGVS